MKNKKSIILLVVLLGLLLAYMVGHEQITATFQYFLNPTVRVQRALETTLAAQSGEIELTVNVSQNGFTASAKLDMEFERSSEKSGAVYIKGTGGLMETSMAAEGWANFDLNDPNNPQVYAVGSVPLLSKWFVFDTTRFHVTQDMLEVQNTEEERQVLRKHWSAVKWAKSEDNVYTTTLTQSKINEFLVEVAPGVSPVSTGGIKVTLTMAGKEVEKIEFDGETSGAIEFKNMGTKREITMPTVDAENAEYYEQMVDPSNILLYINGKKTDLGQMGIIENDVVLVPARSLIEELGGQMLYREEADGRKMVTGRLDSKMLAVELNTQNAWANGTEVKLTVVPVNRDGTIYIPARFITESLGKNMHSYKNAVGKIVLEIT